MVGYVVPYMEPSISPSTIMEAAFGRLHNSGAGAFGARPTVVESIMVDGEIDGCIYSALAKRWISTWWDSVWPWA